MITRGLTNSWGAFENRPVTLVMFTQFNSECTPTMQTDENITNGSIMNSFNLCWTNKIQCQTGHMTYFWPMTNFLCIYLWCRIHISIIQAFNAPPVFSQKKRPLERRDPVPGWYIYGCDFTDKCKENLSLVKSMSCDQFDIGFYWFNTNQNCSWLIHLFYFHLSA